MSFWGRLLAPDDPTTEADRELSAERQADILRALRAHSVPSSVRDRLDGARSGSRPWLATLTPAELAVARSHGLQPVAAVSATCCLQLNWSWANGHVQGWSVATRRLRAEAKAAGANAVLDVKMRTLQLPTRHAMDFSLVGTAVRVDGLPPSEDPILSTVPALEFVRLVEAGVVPTGLAVGANWEWMADPYDWEGFVRGVNRNHITRNNIEDLDNPTGISYSDYLETKLVNRECTAFSELMARVRTRAIERMQGGALQQGNGVLAHIHAGDLLERRDEKRGAGVLARHIVIATTVDAERGTSFPHPVRIVVDMHAGKSPLGGAPRHHQSYATNDHEGGIGEESD